MNPAGIDDIRDELKLLHAQEAQLMAIPMQTRYVRGCALIVRRRIEAVEELLARIDDVLPPDLPGYYDAMLALCDTDGITYRDIDIVLRASGDTEE